MEGSIPFGTKQVVLLLKVISLQPIETILCLSVAAPMVGKNINLHKSNINLSLLVILYLGKSNYGKLWEILSSIVSYYYGSLIELKLGS